MNPPDYKCTDIISISKLLGNYNRAWYQPSDIKIISISKLLGNYNNTITISI